LAASLAQDAVEATDQELKASDFNDANFRVRLTSVVSDTSRDFSLNWVAAPLRHLP
jgi:hypothetical protein